MADKKQTKVYLIPEGETRDSHTYHYTVIKTRKFAILINDTGNISYFEKQIIN